MQVKRKTCIFLAFLLAGCHRNGPPLTPTPGPAPDVAERPAGYACTRRIPTALPPATLFKEAGRALHTMGMKPAFVYLDSTSARITLAGASAPSGKGTAAQRDARLYLDWRVQPSQDLPEPYEIHIAAGLSLEPSGLSPEERKQVYAQAEKLAERFTAAMPSHPGTIPFCR